MAAPLCDVVGYDLFDVVEVGGGSGGGGRGGRLGSGAVLNSEELNWNALKSSNMFDVGVGLMEVLNGSDGRGWSAGAAVLQVDFEASAAVAAAMS